MTRAERRRLEKLTGNKPVVYQYTAAQIEEIKRQAVQAQKEKLKKILTEEFEEKWKAKEAAVNQAIDEEWKRRAELLGGTDAAERMEKVLGLLLSVPARILVDKFHWKPIRDENDRRSKLLQFSEAVVAEVNRICGDDYADIRVYSQETYEKCGVKYELQDESGGDAVG